MALIKIAYYLLFFSSKGLKSTMLEKILILMKIMMMVLVKMNLFAAGVLAADLGSIVVPREDRIRSVFRIVSKKT